MPLVHPHLHFIMQLGGGVDGELVGAQLLRTIPDRQWLFKFGRVPMNFVLSDRMWERFRAPEALTKQGQARCKVSVMAQSVAHLSETVPYDSLQPYGEHFHPERYNAFEEKFTNLEKRRAGTPHVAAGFLPMQNPLIKPGDLDYWDYVVRKLFVVKATPLEKSISALGPGAYNILKYFTNPADPKDRLDISKSPRSFTVDEWNLVVQAFKNWPFRPMVPRALCSLSIENF
ncbi:hypothetical protein CVT25_015875 [Psilocybe cyanescens]|uniref:Uncharacterized protein n=1 Tax=Psilocybe cyanescens TaxID=93625 RepID=A0A409XIJ9_PSICY|nr:hypothetical protein CVT25_015875 [Psilocybe cyanescens]